MSEKKKAAKKKAVTVQKRKIVPKKSVQPIASSAEFAKDLNQATTQQLAKNLANQEGFDPGDTIE